MNIYDLSDTKRKELEEIGVDWSLSGCLDYNPQSFDILDIEKVVAVWEGEKDGDDWRWIIRVTKKCAKKNGGRYVFLQGGCDYTGWDCQSWAKSSFAKTALGAAKFAETGPQGATAQEAVVGMGMGRLLSALSGEYMKNAPSVYEELVKQIKSQKNKTWREKKDAELGTSDIPKV